ncbi:zona pellucida-like domain-containing protein 1 [Ascaphus truei]|uniref:zona pellucida-like domain-containing protein 1 n=1 Tax=Ascaphus truei TaxID=8439 RepID=UPI003F5A8054
MGPIDFLLLGLFAQQCLGQTYNCSNAYQRYPENSDIIVSCGPTEIILTINACPVQFAMFDPTQLALNGKHNLSYCMGRLDTTVSPPVMKYIFPVNGTTENTCENSIAIESSQGSGVFQDYSNVQTVVISGFVDTPVSSETGMVSYSTNLNYNFSCHYPLQYLLNNTQLLTSSANVAINMNNGSFISTLSMNVFIDNTFSTALQFNGSALPLKKKVYVQVSATNLTANFNVLLDQCFATPSPLITTVPSEKYSLLTGCNTQNKTTLLINGAGKSAQFSFETFRFLQHSNQQTSTIYLHCITRLCQPDQCAQFLQGCGNRTSTSRRKRAADTNSLSSAQGTTDSVTVSSGPIYTTDGAGTLQASSQSSNGADVNQLQGTLTGLIVGLIIAAMLGAGLLFGSVILYKMYRLKASQTEKNGVDNFAFNGK